MACKFMHCPFVFTFRGVLLNTLTFPWFVQPSLVSLLYPCLLYLAYIIPVLDTTPQLHPNIIITFIFRIQFTPLYVFVLVCLFSNLAPCSRTTLHIIILLSLYIPYTSVPLLFILIPVCTHNPVPLLLPHPVCGGVPTVG